MTAGTRILLLVAALFVGTLVVYYGFIMSPPVATTVGEVSLSPESGDATLKEQPGPPPPPHGTSVRSRRSHRDNSGQAHRSKEQPVIAMGEALSSELAARVEPEKRAEPEKRTEEVRGGQDSTDESTGAPELPTEVERAPKAPVEAGATTSPPAANEAAANRTRQWTIRSGDTLSSIAEATLGDANRWQEILDANPGLRANRLRVGQTITLPPKSGPAKPVANQGGTTRTHTVESGDSLSTIARQHLGSSARWDEIYELNRKLLGGDPDALKVGMKLRIPSRR